MGENRMGGAAGRPVRLRAYGAAVAGVAAVTAALLPLRGAINFMRQKGAEQIILAGASLGGVASAKLAVETSPNALIIVASPREIEDWGFEIRPGDVKIDMPKLFITAENDSVVPASKTRELFDLVAEPKEWQTYPGSAHGTDLFETENKEELQQRILNFILSVTSIRQPI